MFSIEVAVRAQFRNVFKNAVATRVPVVLNMLAGKSARLLQPFQAARKNVPDEVSIKGKLVRLEQPSQACMKFVPAAVLINGKLVRLLQLRQAC